MGPLSGIKILDFTWALSGPFATMILCDLGAEVIKVERPDTGDMARQNGPFIDGHSLYFASINRGKKSIVLDLKTDEDKALLFQLVKDFDVVTENFVPGAMDRLGMGYEELKKYNPALIYASCSAFGQTGPYRQKPGLDIIVQGMGGAMSITGEEGGPPVRPGFSQGDISAGLFLAIGILGALVERDKSKQGQKIDVSMLDCQVAVLEYAYVRYMNTGVLPERLGTRHPSITPFQAFPTRDSYIVISVTGGIEQWAIFTQAIGRPELLSDPRFHDRTSRTTYHKILEPMLIEAFREKTTSEWLEILEAVAIPCGALNNIADGTRDPQIKHRNMLIELPDPNLGSFKAVNTPIKLSRTPAQIEKGAPKLGEHTQEILKKLL